MKKLRSGLCFKSDAGSSPPSKRNKRTENDENYRKKTHDSIVNKSVKRKIKFVDDKKDNNLVMLTDITNLRLDEVKHLVLKHSSEHLDSGAEKVEVSQLVGGDYCNPDMLEDNETCPFGESVSEMKKNAAARKKEYGRFSIFSEI